MGGEKVGRGRVARKKWTMARTTRFMETLAITSNVTAAASAAQMTTDSAYRRRMREPAFQRAWLEALAEGYAHLEMEMLERARFGTAKGIGDGGKRDFADANGLRLLQAHRETVAAYRIAEGLNARDPDEVLAEVRRRIEAAERG